MLGSADPGVSPLHASDLEQKFQQPPTDTRPRILWMWMNGNVSAVGITKDNELIIEVAEKIGLSDSRGNPTPAMQPFIQEHLNWAMNNRAWVQEHLDPAKAREYVMEHK